MWKERANLVKEKKLALMETGTINNNKISYTSLFTIWFDAS